MKLSQIASSLGAHMKQFGEQLNADFRSVGQEFEEAHCVVAIGDVEYRVASAHYRRNQETSNIELVHVVDQAKGPQPVPVHTIEVVSTPDPAPPAAPALNTEQPAAADAPAAPAPATEAASTAAN